MKLRRQIPTALLAGAMTLSMLTPAWAVEDSSPAGQAAGGLQAAVRLDYSQELDVLRSREIQAELFRGRTSLGQVDLTEAGAAMLDGCPAQVSLRDRLGGELTGSALPGALDLSVTGLPLGSYTLRFTGRGYATCDVPFTLSTHSQYVEVGTGDGTFALGDFDRSGQVDEDDRDALSAALGSTRRSDLAEYDLNGDGEIDIIDLAYVNHNANLSDGTPLVLDTACLGVRLDAAQAAADLAAAGTVVTSGSLDTLLEENSGSALFQRSSGRGDIRIPIPLEAPIEAENLQIVTPSGARGEIQAGTVEVECENEPSFLIPFDNTLPAGTHAVTRTPGTSVITIALGKRVAVKKITITVTETADGQYAAVETIRFLKDIVPEELTEPNSQVKNLTASAGDAQVDLTWTGLPNVSGYLVEYWPKEAERPRRQLQVDVPQASVTGLDNLKTYQFTVTPTDGSWQGRACAPAEATPQPAKAPSPPDMVNVTPLDGQLAVSWKAAKNATYYEVYYTDQQDAPTSAYRPAGDRLTDPSTVIGGLTNGTAYYIYVISGNETGRSGPSRIYSGTPVAVDYSRPEGIPTQGILDSGLISDIRLADRGNYNASQYTSDAPFTPQNMIDGDYRTHWTASTNWSRDEHVVCTFTQPVDLSAAIWVPRLDGSYPSNLRAYSVRVWLRGDDLNGEGRLLVPDPARGGVDGGGTGSDVWTWPDIPNRASIPTSKFAILPFGPVTDVVKISLAAEQRDYTAVSLSELMFLEYDPAHSLPDNIAALFADGLRTQLASGVTQSQIDALKARLAGEERNYYLNPASLDDELVLAQELLDSGSTQGVVLRGVQSRSSAADSRRYGQGGSELQPLGAAAKAGQEITVYAQGIPEGEQVVVYAAQYNAEASAWLAQAGTLVNGRNILTVPKIGSQNTERGGSLYFTYSGSRPEEIQMHVRRAADIPTLELSDWYILSESARRERIGAYVDELAAYVPAQGINAGNAKTKALNVTEISLPSVLLSLPADAVLAANGQSTSAKIENLYQNTLAWEDLMHICLTTQGIDDTYENSGMTSRQNIRCMQMFTGAFMYAAGSHIGIGYGSCGGMVSGQPISSLDASASANRLFGWGIAHEIGHNMDKLGRAEITNNIYSLMAQTYDGEQNTFPSRLEVSGKYPAVFAKTAQGWPGESNDVFVQLGMYWQLHLAYDSGEAPMDFYSRFFKAWKGNLFTEGMEGLSYDERVALTASGTAGRNLTEFFTRWGMTLSDAVTARLSRYDREDRAIWYLSDQSRRDRLDGAQPAEGTFSASAVLTGDNTIQVSVQSELTQGSLQGFEILRNGTPIAFTAPGADGSAVYRDVIGSGNHRTYRYQVIPYDTLGNQLDRPLEAGEIRVAYDKTVDPSSYTITRSSSGVTILFDRSTSVSGLKLTGASRPAGGDYTVTVTAAFTDGSGQTVTRTVTAREGSFDRDNQAADDADSYLTYFQKPGASRDDSRIWTYDVQSVQITGIPSSVPDGDIRLVSYAGDDVAFLEGGTAGRLSEDYRYGLGEDDVIPKDTLVIAGTYRGDPRFNTVKVLGRFSKTTAEDGAEPVYEERYLDGYALLFAEIPEDQQVSDISDGLFLFVPNVQREAELQQADASRCDGVNLLPSQIKAVLSRTDLPGASDSQRVTAETVWTGTPGGEDLPVIVLEEG